jgi:hypothetical protein
MRRLQANNALSSQSHAFRAWRVWKSATPLEERIGYFHTFCVTFSSNLRYLEPRQLQQSFMAVTIINNDTRQLLRYRREVESESACDGGETGNTVIWTCIAKEHPIFCQFGSWKVCFITPMKKLKVS